MTSKNVINKVSALKYILPTFNRVRLGVYEQSNLNNWQYATSVRYAFNNAYFKIDEFLLEEKEAKKKYWNTIDKIREDMNNRLESMRTDRSDQGNLRKMFKLASTDQDIDLIIKTIKNNLVDNTLSQEELSSYLIILMRLIYSKNRTELGLELMNDPDLGKHILGTYSALFMMNKLVLNKRYEDCVKYFELQMPYFDKNVSSSNKVFSLINQTVPFDQITLLTESLLKINTPEALNKFKLYYEFMQLNESVLPRTSLLQAFLLAINQDDPKFALQLAQQSVVELDAKVNLEAIAYARCGLLNMAVMTLRQIFSIRNYQEGIFNGKVYPLTLKAIKEAIEKNKSTYHLNVFEKIWTQIKSQNRLSPIDLDVACDIDLYRKFKANYSKELREINPKGNE